MTKKLTAKQERFIAEYLLDLNATQAAIRAGYPVKSAYSVGSENLKKPEIREVVDEKLQEILDNKHQILKNRVIDQLEKIAFADVDNPDPKAISGRDTETKIDSDGNETQKVKFKLFDKNTALITLSKYLNLIDDTSNVTVNIPDKVIVEWPELPE